MSRLANECRRSYARGSSTPAAHATGQKRRRRQFRRSNSLHGWPSAEGNRNTSSAARSSRSGASSVTVRGGPIRLLPLSSPSATACSIRSRTCSSDVPPASATALRPHSGVREHRHEHRHERCFPRAPLIVQCRSDPLNGLGRKWHDRPVPPHRRLPHRARRIRSDPLPLDGVLEDAPQHGERLADGLAPDAKACKSDRIRMNVGTLRSHIAYARSVAANAR
jgi:hypothetical protein